MPKKENKFMEESDFHQHVSKAETGEIREDKRFLGHLFQPGTSEFYKRQYDHNQARDQGLSEKKKKKIFTQKQRIDFSIEKIQSLPPSGPLKKISEKWFIISWGT